MALKTKESKRFGGEDSVLLSTSPGAAHDESHCD